MLHRSSITGHDLDILNLMINGAHLVLFSKNPEADRKFLTDVLEFLSVDAGRGWLIFKLPPAELAVHPSEGEQSTQLYLMCDDLEATMDALKAKSVACTKVDAAPWGLKTTIKLPSGGEIGLYQPKHPTALGL